MLSNDIEELQFNVKLLIMIILGMIAMMYFIFSAQVDVMSNMYEGYTSIEQHKILKYKEVSHKRDSIYNYKLDKLELLIKQGNVNEKN